MDIVDILIGIMLVGSLEGGVGLGKVKMRQVGRSLYGLKRLGGMEWCPRCSTTQMLQRTRLPGWHCSKAKSRTRWRGGTNKGGAGQVDKRRFDGMGRALALMSLFNSEQI